MARTIITTFTCFMLAFGSVEAGDADSQAATWRFRVAGSNREGFYREITPTVSPAATRLQLERIRHFADVGGLRVETNPSYEISGKYPGGAVALSVELEDLVDRSGGIAIQTGQIAHVKGSLGGRAMALDIHERRMIANVGGVPVEAETWKEVVPVNGNTLTATMRRVLETERTGGILVQTGAHETFRGQDGERAFDFTLRETHEESDDDETFDQTLELAGTGTEEALVLALALRPFLRP